MTAKVFAATNIGFDGELIEVECDASNGLPGLLIVGLGNKAIDEARERVRSAIKNTQLEFIRKRITINLAPANLPKVGAHFDLSIAIALLTISGQVPQASIDKTMFVGELALDGSLRPVRGIIGLAETARRHQIESIVVPMHNAAQASLVDGIKILPAASLRDIYLHFSGKQELSIYIPAESDPAEPTASPVDLADIKGQEQAKRALVIAAAGHHNILFSGPPGAGKTMLAKALAGILPPLSRQEVIEVTKLHSLAGETYAEVLTHRPFRAPHHSTSHVALTGGGTIPRPGEISLAHRGVLFLDELPEYSRSALESLRQPLEDRRINIVRANDRATYPADFMLIATKNPCPCGYFGDPDTLCSCSMQHLQMYQKKLSGPLLDRIDMIIEVSRVNPDSLLAHDPEHGGFSSEQGRKTVLETRARQYKRFGDTHHTNTHLASRNIATTAHLTETARHLLDKAAKALNLSARSYFKTIKVARTIADLEASETINPAHISESLQYRTRTRDN